MKSSVYDNKQMGDLEKWGDFSLSILPAHTASQT